MNSGVRSVTGSLTRKILLGLILGFAVGAVLNRIGGDWSTRYLVQGLFAVGSQIFIASLKLLVVPLVFVSLVCGTASLDDVKKIGKIGVTTLAFYAASTVVAIALALAVGLTLRPGAGFVLASAQRFEVGGQAPSLVEALVNIVPSNPVKAMAEGEMLQIIFFALLVGIALALTGKKAQGLSKLFGEANEVIMKMVMILMGMAPYGVFFLMAKMFAEQGLGVLLPLARYSFVVVSALLLHSLLIYPLMLKLLGGLSPATFLRKFKEVALFAFSTASSNATLPVTLEVAEHRLGVNNAVAAFTIPLGATVNMNGTAIMQGLATVFIAQVYGVDIGIGGFLTVIVMGTLASIGTAGVPGVGLITLAMILRQVNLPVEGIALIMGVDRLLDMMRTVVNVMGDVVVTCVVANREGQLDRSVYGATDTQFGPQV